MAVTTAKIRAREKARGKKAYTALDSAGNLHYAFDKTTLNSILIKANNKLIEKQSAKTLASYNAQQEKLIAANNAAQQDAISYAETSAANNNAFNAQQAQKQMDFQAEMSNTAHQREVKDLLAAGLNPILSANNGASTPSGASSSADTSATTLKAQYALQKLQAGVALKQTQMQIQSAQKMAKWSNDLNRELSYASLSNSKDIADIQAASSMYGAQLASSASRYGAELSSSASRYATDNPNNPYMYLLKGLLGDSSSAGDTAKTVARKIAQKTTGFELFKKYKKYKAGADANRKKYEASKK